VAKKRSHEIAATSFSLPQFSALPTSSSEATSMLIVIIMGIVIGACAPTLRLAVLVPPFLIGAGWCFDYWYIPEIATQEATQTKFLLWAIAAMVSGFVGKWMDKNN
jgi:hypothetical protein